jgi:hypothetical protein
MRSAVVGLTALVLTIIASCRPAPAGPHEFAADPALLHEAVHTLTEAMIEAVTSPVVSARTYAYSSIAAYEALRPDYPQYLTLAGQLNGLESFPAPNPEQEYVLPLASAVAFLSVAEKLAFRPDNLTARREAVIEQARRARVPQPILARSVEYGQRVAQHTLEWAAQDNLQTARALPRYEVRRDPGRWLPTPPAYIAAVEPHWAILRPFTMDSASQFRPPPPVPYDLTEGSPFYRELVAVYDAGENLTDEQREIAAFWDCNPYALKAEGHFMFAVKKLSPGGHWMGITELALRQHDADMMRAAEAYARVGMVLHDAFISTWDEKYSSVLIRPETLINEKIDPMWRPVLQTPPFPEYTSGHSVISTAASEVLTDLFGDDFVYDDTVQIPFGLPVRSFTSFRQAAAEAAISRLYGGIHYPMAIEHGQDQGRAVGENFLARLETRSPAHMASGSQEP